MGACVVGSASCTRVDPGHVGIRVRLAGSSRGVQTPIVTGWVMPDPLAELVVEFPTSVQNIVWTRDAREGSPADESITFASRGVSVNADVGLAFHIDADKAPRLYGRFRQRDVLVLARTATCATWCARPSTRPPPRCPCKTSTAPAERLLNESLRKVTERLSSEGFVIDELTFDSALRLPDNVVAAINRAMEATQNAIQAENRVRQTRAEADHRWPPPAVKPKPRGSGRAARPTGCSFARAPRRRPTRSFASR